KAKSPRLRFQLAATGALAEDDEIPIGPFSSKPCEGVDQLIDLLVRFEATYRDDALSSSLIALMGGSHDRRNRHRIANHTEFLVQRWAEIAGDPLGLNHHQPRERIDPIS